MDTTSHWISSGSLPRYPRLGKDLSVDVVIVGGGITGITAAHLCQKAGLSFALLERDRLARRDTGHTTAHLTAVPDLRLAEILKTFGTGAARAVWDAGSAAIDRIAHIVHDLDLKDDKFGSPEAPTVGAMIDGLQRSHADDHELLEHGITMFESLFRSYEGSTRQRRPRAVAARPKSHR